MELSYRVIDANLEIDHFIALDFQDAGPISKALISLNIDDFPYTLGIHNSSIDTKNFC